MPSEPPRTLFLAAPRPLRAQPRTIIHAAGDRDVSAVNRFNRELRRRVFQPSPLAIYLAEAEKFWTLSEPYRLLHLAAADAPVAAEHRGR